MIFGQDIVLHFCSRSIRVIKNLLRRTGEPSIHSYSQGEQKVVYWAPVSCSKQSEQETSKIFLSWCTEFCLLSLGDNLLLHYPSLQDVMLCAAALTYHYLYNSLLRVNFDLHTHAPFSGAVENPAVCCGSEQSNSNSAFRSLQGQEW